MTTHTFVIEIDRQGESGEQLRWKWRQSQTGDGSMPTTVSSSASASDNTSVAKDLLRFLDTRILSDDTEWLALAAKDSSRAQADPLPRVYSVEMHDPARGWISLLESTTSATIPRNCRVHVKVDKEGKPRRSGGDKTSLSEEKGASNAAPPPPAAEKARYDTNAAAVAGGMLALPWRRFDRELGERDGLKICGRPLVIGDVPNASTGTGLFTWDGSVLLAKYLEHEAFRMRRDFHSQQARCKTRSLPPEHEKDDTGGGDITVAPDDRGCSTKSQPPPVRVLELGCGTGLAGLAAALAFGRQEGGEDNGESEAPLRCPARRSRQHGDRAPKGVSSSRARGVEAEVVLTDLEYALANARANIQGNAPSLEAVGSVVTAMELDWCRPLPECLDDADSFDIILAADAVWLDELVGPLVRTLERLTANWAPGSSGDNSNEREDTTRPPTPPAVKAPSEAASEQGSLGTDASLVLENGTSQQHQATSDDPPRVRTRPQAGRRVLMAYQWRSQRTGKALLDELSKAFHVREIPPEECHGDFLPSTNLCLFEAVRRGESPQKAPDLRPVCRPP